MFFNKINLYLTLISANKPAVWHCIPMQHPGPFAMAWGIWAIRSGLDICDNAMFNFQMYV
jgi:hypothetical protein